MRASSTSLADKNQLQRFLAMRPETAAVNNLLPEEEAVERLQFARHLEHELQVRMADPDFHLSSFDMSVICNLPLAIIREASNLEFSSFFLLVQRFVQICKLWNNS